MSEYPRSPEKQLLTLAELAPPAKKKKKTGLDPHDRAARPPQDAPRNLQGTAGHPLVPGAKRKAALTPASLPAFRKSSPGFPSLPRINLNEPTHRKSPHGNPETP